MIHVAMRFSLFAGCETPPLSLSVVSGGELAGLGIDTEGRINPQAALLRLAPCAAGIPFVEHLLGEPDIFLGLGAVIFLQRRRFENLGGHQQHGAQEHRLAQLAVRDAVGALDAGLALLVRKALGPAEVAVRLFHAALDDGIAPIEQPVHPLAVAGGHVAIVEAVQERADEPADLLAHFFVAIAVPAAVAEDVLLPAAHPVFGERRIHGRVRPLNGRTGCRVLRLALGDRKAGRKNPREGKPYPYDRERAAIQSA